MMKPATGVRLVLLFVAFASGGGCSVVNTNEEESKMVLLAMYPGHGMPGQAVEVTIHGKDFWPKVTVNHQEGQATVVNNTFTASLGDKALDNVTYVDDKALTAVVPADLMPGLYDLTVQNPEKCKATLADAFIVTPLTYSTPPIADFVVVPVAGTTATSFLFNAAPSFDSQDADIDMSFSWDWESDGSSDHSGISVSHSFSSVGLHQITLKVENTQGLVDYFIGSVVVVAPAELLMVTGNGDTVTDDGVTTLREAIQAANSDAGPNTITFSDPMQIVIHSELPLVSDDWTTIAGGPGVVVDGSHTKENNNCIFISSDHNTVLWLEVMACHDATIKVIGSHNTIKHCTLHDSRKGVMVDVGNTNVIGPENTIFNCDTGVRVKGDNTVVRDNLIYSNRDGIVVDASSLQVIGNTISNSSGWGIKTSKNNSDQSVFWHNTIHDSGNGAIKIDSDLIDIDIRNNVLTNCAGVCIESNSILAVLDYNNYLDPIPGTPLTGCSPGPHALFVNPFYLDPGALDFRLHQTSECIDAGTNLSVDTNGPEPGNYNIAAPDMGAHEY